MKPNRSLFLRPFGPILFIAAVWLSGMVHAGEGATEPLPGAVQAEVQSMAQSTTQSATQQATPDEAMLAVTQLQHEWDVIKYQVSAGQQAKRYESLAARAHALSTRYPRRAEPLIWEGIIVSSLAGAKGGMGALKLARQAKALYESAIHIDGRALEGSAYNSLGVLYYKVPGWPLGFGDDTKARELIGKALSINPQGIDPNFFQGEFLVEQDKPAEALPYLERALAAPPRPGREIADAGRRDEARALIAKIRAR